MMKEKKDMIEKKMKDVLKEFDDFEISVKINRKDEHCFEQYNIERTVLYCCVTIIFIVTLIFMSRNDVETNILSLNYVGGLICILFILKKFFSN